MNSGEGLERAWPGALGSCGPLSLGGWIQLALDESEASDPSGGYLKDEGEKLEPVHVLAGPAPCLYRYIGPNPTTQLIA